MGQGESSREIFLTIEESETQSQQLYDFNSRDNKTVVNQPIKSNSIIARDGQKLIYQTNIQHLPPLYSVKIDACQVEMVMESENEKELWRVLRQEEEYPLQQGTTVKLGKVKLKLKDIIEEEKEMTEKDMKSKSICFDRAEVKSQSGQSNASQENQCRICFETTNEKENPLVCLCKCSGSVKYTHFQCLRDWIANHVVKRQHNNTLFYSYQETKCEICQEFYQPEFYLQGRKYLLLDLDNAPNAPYAIFESIEEDEANNKRFSVFLIGLGEEEITIGRNSNCAVVMKEISISRSHCALLFKNRRLYIRDKGSKFGTLIKVQQEIEFSPRMGLSLQFESKLITIREKGGLQCCCAQSDSFILRVNRGGFVQRKIFQSQGLEAEM